MQDDGVISWYSKTDVPYLENSIQQLEQKCDLEFEKVKRRRNADIIVKHVNKLQDPEWLAVAEWGAATDYRWSLRILRDAPESSVVHEFGHALGLSHPADHYANTKTMMSYARNHERTKYWKQDLVNIDEIYNPDKRDIISNHTRVYDEYMLPDIMIVTTESPHLHDKELLGVDYLTGISICTKKMSGG